MRVNFKKEGERCSKARERVSEGPPPPSTASTFQTGSNTLACVFDTGLSVGDENTPMGLTEGMDVVMKG